MWVTKTMRQYRTEICSVVLFIVLGLMTFPFDNIVRHPDSSHHFSIARRYPLSDLRLFSHGLYPGGYPAILRFFLQYCHIHPFVTGKLLSFISALFMLLIVMIVARRFAGGQAALWSGLVLMGNEVFIMSSRIEGTDCPAALFQLIALLVFICDKPGESVGTKRAAFIGLSLGIGYLFRFTAMILVPLFVLILILDKHGIRRISVFISGFIVGSFPQLYGSFRTRGNPLYNEQIHNVWFALHGNWDWRRYWEQMPDGFSLWKAISSEPVLFFNNWFDNAKDFFYSGSGWLLPLPLILLLYLLLKTHRHAKSLGCLVGYAVLPVSVTSIAFCRDRLGIVTVLALSITFGLFMCDLIRNIPQRFRYLPRAATITLLLMTISGVIPAAMKSSLERDVLMEYGVDRFIKTLGIERVETVATNLMALFDTDDPWMTPYSRFKDLRSAHTVDGILEERDPLDDWQFIILDYGYRSGDFLQIKRETEIGGSKFAPIAYHDSIGFYMVRPTTPGESETDSLFFSRGPILLAHSWSWNDDILTVFLFWTARDTLEADLEVCVSIRNERKEEIALHCGIPEMGTYPTFLWKPGIIIADVHILDLEGIKESTAKINIGLSDRKSQSMPYQYHEVGTINRNRKSPLP